jgi:hypothetical protein
VTWPKALALGLLIGLCLGWVIRGKPRPIVIPPALQAQVHQVQASHLPDTLTKFIAQVDNSQKVRQIGKDSVARVLTRIEQSPDSMCLQNIRQAIRAAAYYNERWIGAEGQLSLSLAYLGAARDTLMLDREVVDGLVGIINHARQPKPLRWAAGPVFELGRLVPVGGSLDRDLGPIRARLEVTDGPGEPVTARFGLEVRF